MKRKKNRQPKSSKPRIVPIDMRPIAERYADDGSDSERRFFANLAIHNAIVLRRPQGLSEHIYRCEKCAKWHDGGGNETPSRFCEDCNPDPTIPTEFELTRILGIDIGRSNEIAKDTTGRGGVEADGATKRILGPSSKVSRP